MGWLAPQFLKSSKDYNLQECYHSPALPYVSPNAENKNNKRLSSDDYFIRKIDSSQQPCLPRSVK
ncbi:hypothetical protein QQ39_07950 [Pragia fontium]|nr:hypothetical protein QQ39_07950 [Pragia fontium]